MMLKVVAASDVVITTALIPGKKAPILLTTEMVEAMPPGSVIVDLAAERGGNCELTRPDEVVVHKGVTIIGPSNPPALVPYHASQMYSKNIITFLTHLLGKDRRAAGRAADRHERRNHARDAVDAGRRTSSIRGSASSQARPGPTTVTVWMLKTLKTRNNRSLFRITAGQRQDRRPGRARRLHRRRRAGLAAALPPAAGAAELEVNDLDSTNGTYVNGERVDRATLKDGDRLRRRPRSSSGDQSTSEPSSSQLDQKRIRPLLPPDRRRLTVARIHRLCRPG